MKHPIHPKLTDSRLSRVAVDIAAMLQPAIRLKTFACREDEWPPGSSRIGGRPDLDDGVAWPVWNDMPPAFLAQINLADLAPFRCAHVLPREGWLLFFYDAEQSTWGFDPRDRGSWAVIFQPQAGARLERRRRPSEKIFREDFYKPCRVEMDEITTAPPWESTAMERLGLSREEQEAYRELLEELYPEGEARHQILGHPQPIQGDMRLECQLVSNGLYCGDASGYHDPRAGELAKGAEDWKLLFQLDSDENAAMTWGDVGRLYFWIHQESLRNQDLEKTWTVLQSY